MNECTLCAPAADTKLSAYKFDPFTHVHQADTALVFFK